MDWESAARRLAAETVIRPESRWYQPLATTPRHLFVPRWWTRTTSNDAMQAWELRDGAGDTDAWLREVYADTTLVTRVGPHHADHAETGQTLPGQKALRSTSSSTLPTLVLLMYRAAFLTDTSRLLVTTGSGYGTALACARLGEEQVTSVDVDPYLVQAARERLSTVGHHPRVQVCDLTGPLPDGGYDRIVSTVAVPTVPLSWLTALAPDGRLVTTLANTGLIIVADKTPDGGAVGHVAPEAAGFMTARHSEDYDDTFPDNPQVWQTAQHAEGERVTTSRYPLMYVPDTWDVRSTLELLVPGIDHRQHTTDDGTRTLYMLHADGSWARATAAKRGDSPTVHQSGPRRLWDELDRIRTWLAVDGDLPIRGATVTIAPDGTATFSRRGWSTTVPHH
ncbi:protein-L-isoaspartate O-methyltransferase family protein [Streptomyces pseudovenezuelae]|uniref:Protein-L-isoaspartate O-methyltransferase n=1 Tax=Streptomyces pseudovenezuelae TaxID=67350 RepID=A0ABT6M2G2_9ACTN|nr:methyltransferase domain-containing protein [Streptomyces pseudovenezuelae]MDH6222741.1 protein-L-isoaspartate O-methyltransferase [Streptomyces pseudovenezuelae]